MADDPEEHGTQPVRHGRASVLVLLIVVVAIATLGFLYGVPSGRHVRRESLRIFRLAGNITGIYRIPVLTLRTWSPARGALLVELYESGRVVVSGRGDPFERQLTPAVAGEMFEKGRAAFGDFSSDGCGTERGGISSELYLLLDGRRA